MTTECWAKCVPHLHDAELALGEMSCIDRCVPKYFEVHQLVKGEYDRISNAAVEQEKLKEQIQESLTRS